jgi:hypothetical protein
MVPGMEIRVIDDKLWVDSGNAAKYRSYAHHSLRGKRDWCGNSIMEIKDEWTERPSSWAVS